MDVSRRYMCYATNRLGSSQDTVQVTLDHIQGTHVEKGDDVEEEEEEEQHAEKMEGAQEEVRAEMEDFRKRMELELAALRNATARATAASEGEKSRGR